MHIYINRNGQQLGPFEEANIAKMLNDGQLFRHDLMIRQGETEWKFIDQSFPQLAGTRAKPSGSVFGVLMMIFGVPISLFGAVCAFLAAISIDSYHPNAYDNTYYRRWMVIFLVILFIGLITFFIGLLVNASAKGKSRNQINT